jgi:hypothetical protein
MIQAQILDMKTDDGGSEKADEFLDPSTLLGHVDDVIFPEQDVNQMTIDEMQERIASIERWRLQNQESMSRMKELVSDTAETNGDAMISIIESNHADEGEVRLFERQFQSQQARNTERIQSLRSLIDSSRKIHGQVYEMHTLTSLPPVPDERDLSDCLRRNSADLIERTSRVETRMSGRVKNDEDRVISEGLDLQLGAQQMEEQLREVDKDLEALLARSDHIRSVATAGRNASADESSRGSAEEKTS